MTTYTPEFKQELFDILQDALDFTNKMNFPDDAEGNIELNKKQLRYITLLVGRFELENDE